MRGPIGRPRRRTPPLCWVWPSAGVSPRQRPRPSANPRGGAGGCSLFLVRRMHPKRPLGTSPFRRPYEQYREHQEPGGAIYGFGLEGGGVLWFFNPRSYPPPRLFCFPPLFVIYLRFLG